MYTVQAPKRKVYQCIGVKLPSDCTKIKLITMKVTKFIVVHYQLVFVAENMMF